ncbi:MAG TPA: universal stress protein [Longimicrobiales bacterium]|nr:universal stress protein [Longimicrobiales bacterium]
MEMRGNSTGGPAIRSILVPVDGSEFGHTALAWAVPIARGTNARLHLVHVRAGGAHRADDEEERKYLDAVAEEACQALGESVSFAVVDAPGVFSALPAQPRSAVAGALCDYAERHLVGLAVMATHGRRGLGRAWLGSVADGIVRHGGSPVLLVRPGEETSVATHRIRNAIVVLDGTFAGERVLNAALEVAGPGARYTLLRVVPPQLVSTSPYTPPVPAVNSPQVEAARRAAMEYLERTAARLRTREVEVVTGTVVAASDESGARAFADVTGSDLVALKAPGLDRATVSLLAPSRSLLLYPTRLAERAAEPQRAPRPLAIPTPA